VFLGPQKKQVFIGGNESRRIASVIASGQASTVAEANQKLAADEFMSLRSLLSSDDRIDFCKWSQKSLDDRIDFYDLVESKHAISSDEKRDRLEHKRWLKTRIQDRANRKA